MNNGVFLKTTLYRMLPDSPASLNAITMYPDNANFVNNHGMEDPRKKLGIRKGGLPEIKEGMMPSNKMVQKPANENREAPFNFVMPNNKNVGNPISAV